MHSYIKPKIKLKKHRQDAPGSTISAEAIVDYASKIDPLKTHLKIKKVFHKSTLLNIFKKLFIKYFVKKTTKVRCKPHVCLCMSCMGHRGFPRAIYSKFNKNMPNISNNTQKYSCSILNWLTMVLLTIGRG